jgi:hypothetical protein
MTGDGGGLEHGARAGSAAVGGWLRQLESGAVVAAVRWFYGLDGLWAARKLLSGM